MNENEAERDRNRVKRRDLMRRIHLKLHLKTIEWRAEVIRFIT